MGLHLTRPVVVQFSSMPASVRYGGAERVFGSFADELEQAGFTVHSCGLRPRDGQRRDPGYPISNIYWPFDTHRHGVVQRTLWHAIDTFALAAKRTVANIFDELRPDVVITHNLRGWGYAPWVVAGERGLPLVHVVHDYGLICNSSTLWRDGVCADVCKACHPRVTMTKRRWPGGNVVGVSRAVLSEYPRRGIQEFGDGVVVHPTAAAGEVQPARRPSTAGAPRILGFLGRVNEPKGVEALLKAVDGSDKELLLAGEGERDYVERLMAHAPANVRWLGWSDPQSLYDAIDVLVVPSAWLEPFGLIVVEAARAGVPVLIADRPGLIEAAHVSGARYATFAADDVDALRQALDRPLSSYRIGPTTVDQTNLVELIRGLAPKGKDA